MLRGGLLCGAMALASCSEPSRVDPPDPPAAAGGSASSNDPWAAPVLAAATERLVQLVLSFRSSTIQAVAMLPVMP